MNGSIIWISIITVAILAFVFVISMNDGIPTQEEIYKVQSALPDGCKLIDLGEYASIDQLILITCDNKIVTTSQTYDIQQSGKTTVTKQSVVAVISPND